jgi:hypothetical protein
MYATFGNAITGAVGPTLGPWPFAVLTYDTLRAGDARGDADQIARYWNDRWVLDDDGSEWTDITLHMAAEG